MKKTLFLLSVLLMQTSFIMVFARGRPQAGDTISGIISDEDGPMIWVNVTELDSSDCVVAHTVTDLGGKFSFRLVNPENRISIKYVGYETVDIPIDTIFFEIKMKEWDGFSAIDITTDPGRETKGIPIPLREAAKSVDTLDMSEFEDLGIYTIDEALNAKFGLDLPW